jgi:hypothetical protein
MMPWLWGAENPCLLRKMRPKTYSQPLVSFKAGKMEVTERPGNKFLVSPDLRKGKISLVQVRLLRSSSIERFLSGFANVGFCVALFLVSCLPLQTDGSLIHLQWSDRTQNTVVDVTCLLSVQAWRSSA